jgi:hypothetical protein
MAEFGDDFEPDAFRAAYSSEDPVELNRVKAVERGVGEWIRRGFAARS